MKELSVVCVCSPDRFVFCIDLINCEWVSSAILSQTKQKWHGMCECRQINTCKCSMDSSVVSDHMFHTFIVQITNVLSNVRAFFIYCDKRFKARHWTALYWKHIFSFYGVCLLFTVWESLIYLPFNNQCTHSRAFSNLDRF